MIVSHAHRFIFLKTKKTAGTSIELALTKLCGEDDIITPLTAIDEARRVDERGAQNWKRHGWWNSPRPFWKRRLLKFTAADYGFYNHMTADAARTLLNDDEMWRSYFKFAFDRNPWDRQVSFYQHRYRKEPSPPPFPDFIHGDKRARINNYEIYSLAGDVAVDFVGRYENLEADLKHALAQVGLKLDAALPRAKGTFRKDKRPYREFYDNDTRDIVGDWYAREIKLLDYAF
ncbi:MAG TPA: sulfotransferase family 2 domain-containing protein [Methyloceanibacter sp.]|nr:sulfotransferase family 2 domain-containing protein [Methyloceanibacter sp.]